MVFPYVEVSLDKKRKKKSMENAKVLTLNFTKTLLKIYKQ